MFDVSLDERTKELTTILDEMQTNMKSIQALAIVSVEGLPITSKLPANFEETIVAAMTAAMLSLGDQIASTLGKGVLGKIMVEGAHGVVVTMAAGANAVLTASASNDAKLGLLFHQMTNATKNIADILDK